MVEEPDTKSTVNEDYDTYDGNVWSGGIVDNPHVHIYIAHQIPETVTEGEQYVAPSPTTNDTNTDETEEDTDSTEDTSTS